MTITLPATKVTVPDEAGRWTVKSQRSMSTHDGVAFVATVLLDGKPAGSIENEGRGGGTWFRQNTREAMEAFDALAKACADQGLAMQEDTFGYHGGQPFPVNPHEWIADALTTEHDTVKRLNRASKRSTALIKADTDPAVEYATASSLPAANVTDAHRAEFKAAGFTQMWRDGQWVAL